ncbi:DUF2333 family protein [Salinicola acroporae]|uniref:DUF2333 domain-containing protein n=1 Tax=Salinicola acroporae TaxID=1541440 RepID=A0ABT6I8N4_9GAMM|nr:DUF2333 family protein [Salinicola acroporae]MDH4573645.1 DUF2333 domain-containing protein [Salinicola acroporae]
MALFRRNKAPLSRTEVLETPQYGWIWKPLVALVVIYLLACIVLGIWWSWTPAPTDPRQAVEMQRGFPQSVDTGGEEQPVPPGEALLATNISILDTLLQKPGGYLRNDVMPPGLWLDNMPSWEAGVTRQVRDAVAMLGGALSVGNAPLNQANESLGGDLDSWRWPASETLLKSARNNLGEAFTARENSAGPDAPTQDAAASTEPAAAPDSAALAEWLGQVQQRLQTQTQHLAANVGQSPSGDQQTDSTPWLRIDNVFFEARGTTWALAQLLQAARIDYADVIDSSGVGGDFDQLVAELESSQARVWSPVILNGSGFGLFANHSLMMANYTVRASQLVEKIRNQL